MALTYRDAFDSGHLRNYATFMLKRGRRGSIPPISPSACFNRENLLAGLSGTDTLAIFSPYDIVGNLLMLSGWGLHIQPLIGVSWAASAEMGSYLLLPLLSPLTVKPRSDYVR